MRKTNFKLILEGPPRSGKCCFINDLLYLQKVRPYWYDRYTFTEIGDHKLLVQVAMTPFPKEKKE